MHSSHARGAASEYAAASWFAANGWEVFWNPTQHSAIDFIATNNEDTIRVQVKSAQNWRSAGGVDYLRVKIIPYAKDAFDVLVVVSIDGRIWKIPFEKVRYKSELYLWRDKGDGTNKFGWDKWLVN
jgi:hypothetical protein